ncbi:hypothetical protein E3J49_08840 [Candidatus Bathyarchaeota archaeon]|nr:MAG: hypothetical protein E3J49_08840 [Candidatus Bathyarchaeota archaeon]
MSRRRFLEQIDKNEMLHMKDEVSKKFEIPFIMKKCDNKGFVFLFEKLKNYKTKVVANVCGTRKRICDALDTRQNELYERLVEAWRSP